LTADELEPNRDKMVYLRYGFTLEVDNGRKLDGGQVSEKRLKI
jgi:hypothetical protein